MKLNKIVFGVKHSSLYQSIPIYKFKFSKRNNKILFILFIGIWFQNMPITRSQSKKLKAPQTSENDVNNIRNNISTLHINDDVNHHVENYEIEVNNNSQP